MRKFTKFVKMDQASLKAKLYKVLKSYYKEVVCEDGFLYARGSVDYPILLTAHMDTVHEETVKKVEMFKNEGKTIISSPQGIGGDDRCGIWMIYKILTTTKYRPSILFCEDEEIGGVGSSKFADTQYVLDLAELKYLVELDRANDNDAVYYNCGNEDFMIYIEKTIGYKEAYGSFSDIGHLSPACGVASVNLSCGYYKQHTLKEYVVFEEMENTLEKVKVLLEDSRYCEPYDYQEVHWDRWSRYGGYGYGRYEYRRWNDYFYDDEEEEKIEDKKDDKSMKDTLDLLADYNASNTPADGYSVWKYEFWYYTNDGEAEYVCYAKDLETAVGEFLMKHPTISWNDVYDYATY